MVIITDGRSDDSVQSIIQANLIKNTGVKIICVGVVSTIDLGFNELQQIATNPEEAIRLQVTSFGDLRNKSNTLLNGLCVSQPTAGTWLFTVTFLCRLIQ
jgi:von Willebrand factor type A domain